MSDFLKSIADFSPKRLMMLAAELEQQVRSLQKRPHAPIAIIGMGCRYPGGVRDAESFWELLSEGRDAITEVPATRWDVSRLFDPNPAASDKVASKWGGFLDAPELFDADFFGIAPVEAAAMDPQQRLLLEVSWEALENAAIAPSTLDGSRTGVYVGLCNSDYAQRSLKAADRKIDAHFAQGASHAVAAGRISYFLGLRGPSLAIDTACSSSLVAVHQACQALRAGEIDMALAGGVNLLFSPEVTMALSRAGMMAPDGRCKTFSAKADGFVRSEGCGVIVLKRLSDASRDGDRVIAVIRGVAVNQDGRSSGLTAPNGPAQESVIRAAMADAGAAAHDVSYVEAHGTGTNLGDPIELRALEAVLGRGREELHRLPVGSVKSNFGHAEAAAGIAGLIKVAIALQHRQIPASLHYDEPNGAIDWAGSRLRVPVGNEEWQPSGSSGKRMGAVSSFGFSGTNAHVLLGEAEEAPEPEKHEGGIRVMTISARSPSALQMSAARLADHLRERQQVSLTDVAYTLATGRSLFPYRAAVRADSQMQLVEELSRIANEDQEELAQRHPVSPRRARVAFLFAGQGGEHSGMGLSLLRHSAVFRSAIAEVDEALAGIVPVAIAKIFANENGELSHSALVQPALYAFQYGVARIWQSWGVDADIVVGHSMGEIVAASLAGILSVAEAARLVAARGRLTGELGDAGGMVAVAASESQIQAVLARYKADVSVAAINGQASIVISGRTGSLEQATRELESLGVRVKRLNITYGSHSPAMQRVLPAFHEEAAKVQYKQPRIPILADLTGERIEVAGFFDAQYFTTHLSRPVQFARCLDQLEKEKCGLCIEMGPRAVLTTFGRERGENGTAWIASATGREDDYLALQTALAEAYEAGAPLQWKTIFSETATRKVALPTYPFERERYWMEDETAEAAAEKEAERLEPKLLREESAAETGSLPGRRLNVAQPVFETVLASPLPFHLEQHRVSGKVLLPASFYLSLALEAASGSDLSFALPMKVRDFKIMSPIVTGRSAVIVQTAIHQAPGDEQDRYFEISSRSHGKEQWQTNAHGWLTKQPGSTARIADPDRLEAASDAASMAGADFYQKLDTRGVQLGEAFRCIQHLQYLPGRAFASLKANDAWHGPTNGNNSAVILHPALMDACFQALGGAALAASDLQLRLMTSIDAVEIFAPLAGEMEVEAQVVPQADSSWSGSIEVTGGTSRQRMLRATGIRLIAAARESSEPAAGADWLYEQAWEPAALPTGRRERSQTDRVWVLLGRTSPVLQAVESRLKSAGENVICVAAVEDLKMNSRDQSAWELVDLRSTSSQSTLLGVSDDAQNPLLTSEAVTVAQQSAALWQHAIAAGSRLWVFTVGSQPGRQSMKASTAVFSPSWGLARCGTLEHPQTLRRIVDLDPQMNGDTLASTIMDELLTADGEEQISYLDGTRRAFRLKQSEAAEIQLSAGAVVFRRDGAYLVTGGLGGLGLRVAAWMVSKGAGTIVLTTRSQGSVSSSEDEVASLRALGATIVVIRVDVAVEQGMQQVFARFGSDGDLPPLRGVIHMAAEISGNPVESITKEEVEAMFRAKVQGTWNLHQLTRSMQLDFFVGFSSTAAVLGAGSLANYAAANSFVDAMASLRAALHLPFVSIAWGTWQTMRLAQEQYQQSVASGGMLPMPDELALGWLGSLLTSAQVRHAMVARVDWSLMTPLYEGQRKRKWLEYMRTVEAADPKRSFTLVCEPGQSRLKALEAAVQKEAARALGYRNQKVPPLDARLADLGMDSLVAVKLRNRLQAMIGHNLPATFAFEYPTASDMALAIDMMLWSEGLEEDQDPSLERDEISI